MVFRFILEKKFIPSQFSQSFINKVVKSYLLALGLDFKEVLVENQETIQYLENKTGQRKVPVIENTKGFVVGFNPEKIKELVS